MYVCRLYTCTWCICLYVHMHICVCVERENGLHVTQFRTDLNTSLKQPLQDEIASGRRTQISGTNWINRGKRREGKGREWGGREREEGWERAGRKEGRKPLMVFSDRNGLAVFKMHTFPFPSPNLGTICPHRWDNRGQGAGWAVEHPLREELR